MARQYMSYTKDGRLAGVGTDPIAVAAAPSVMTAREQAFEEAARECERMAQQQRDQPFGDHIAREVAVLTSAASRIRALARYRN